MKKEIKTPEEFFEENFKGLKDVMIQDENIYLFYKDLIITCIDEYHKQFKPKKEPKVKIEIDQDMVVQFNDMFPKGKAKKTNKYMRCNITEVSKSFERFFKDYDFDWQTIFTATQAYLDAEEDTGNEWTLRSKYFVTKLKDSTLVSELAEWCSRTLEGGYFEGNESKGGFEPKVY